jgi:Fe-S-cluster containining protein
LYPDNTLSVKEALDLTTKRWKIDNQIYDLHLGKRDDVTDSAVGVNGVIFHIPMLSRDGLYVLWRCLWPECHNCCERQGRLPLTVDDIHTIAKKMGYESSSKFIRNETVISSWQEHDAFTNIITNLSMLSLKRRENEREEDDGTPIPCRFLDEKGYCGIHPDKPGVCWLYPFASWLEADSKGRAVVHATFQLTGDCPGFYLSSSMEDMMPILIEYSKRIYDYNMATCRTSRENYGSISMVNLKKDYSGQLTNNKTSRSIKQ